jgi:hypothetical protein
MGPTWPTGCDEPWDAGPALATRGPAAREPAEDLLAAMTFEEKVALADFNAVLHMGIPALDDRGVFVSYHLGPAATREVSLRLDRDELAAFDEASGEWVVNQGRYEVLVGRSSRDIRGRAGFEVGARTPVGP